ncbi:MAG: hypothetical protein H7Z21_17700 [Hymenobacter sp.]|nr:hypothetical protein [Hymenobacter sp.]
MPATQSIIYASVSRPSCAWKVPARWQQPALHLARFREAPPLPAGSTITKSGCPVR